MIDFERIVTSLGQRRPIFYSEADLQHELGMEAVRHDAGISCRLEVPLFPGKNAALDLCLRSSAGNFGVEIKYLTRTCKLAHMDELFELKNQGAQDIRRYDTLKDIQRIEALIGHGGINSGGVLCITNDPAYWIGPRRPGTCDEQFSLREGRILTGTLHWSRSTGAGTQKGRETPISLAGSYKAGWKRFSKIEEHEFRYLWIEVKTPADVQSTNKTNAKAIHNPEQNTVRSTVASSVLRRLNKVDEGVCDDCLSELLNIRPRQTINQSCNKLHAAGHLKRSKQNCSRCDEIKIVNFTSKP